MEAYRISSRLREQEKQYLIQTTNLVAEKAVETTVYVDGTTCEVSHTTYPDDVGPQEVLTLVKAAHAEKKKEIEALLEAYTEVSRRGDPETMYQLGAAFLYKGFLDKAAELFSAVTRMQLDHHQAFNQLALTCMALGRHEEAIEALTAAVEHRPGYADYRNNLGEAYMTAGMSEAAVAELEQAININMYYADAYFNLGLAHIRKIVDQPQQANVGAVVNRVMGIFKKAATVAPELGDERAYIEGMALLEAGQLESAHDRLLTIREHRKQEKRKEFATLYMRYFSSKGWVSEQAIEGRIRYLESELEKNPTYVDLRAELGQCYLELSRRICEKGVIKFREALEMNPKLQSVEEHLAAAEKLFVDFEAFAETTTVESA